MIRTYDRQGRDANHVTSEGVNLAVEPTLKILKMALQMTGRRLARSGVAQGLTSYGIEELRFASPEFDTQPEEWSMSESNMSLIARLF